ncbi:MAG: hypothetical protein U9Q73_01910 [Nanoarchaeota archaeon]|nr:hypothetical protein [Nanoarchaeota archaeon]
MPKKLKEQKKKKGFSYIRKGKTVNVPPHSQGYWRNEEAISKMKRRIIRGKAENLFESRSSRSITMDRKKNARLMFAIPNKFWKDKPNYYDVYGLDGYIPPAVDKPPILGLPYQMVMYEGYIYEADPDGRFIRSMTHIEKLKPESKKNQKRYEEETGLMPILDDGYTLAYSEWLNKKTVITETAKDLVYNDGLKVSTLQAKLRVFKNLDAMGLTREQQEKILIEAYNRTHGDPAKTFTKAVAQWESTGYKNAINKIIRGIYKSEDERLKNANRQEAMETAYHFTPSGDPIGLRVFNEINHLQAEGLIPDQSIWSGEKYGRAMIKHQEDEIKGLISEGYTSAEIENYYQYKEIYEESPEYHHHAMKGNPEIFTVSSPNNDQYIERVKIQYEWILEDIENQLGRQLSIEEEKRLKENYLGEYPIDLKTARNFEKIYEDLPELEIQDIIEFESPKKEEFELELIKITEEMAALAK